MQHLRVMERNIRCGRFLGGDDPEIAVKRLYRTGTIESGGQTDSEGKVDRQFEVMWQLNIELAKSIDWSLIGSSEHDAV